MTIKAIHLSPSLARPSFPEWLRSSVVADFARGFSTHGPGSATLLRSAELSILGNVKA
ncbi:hypothetical protein ACPOL_2394 [Acidisarcina polymorpha]|uniref:Uncharacterized protein n=1 Tax=Acidisarcina polymorpha TaxID=2211140 RepID=A0A2Z5FZC3_9BACT|nr:hypothetical protein ACPOL_2394 [Acidisarcina polymorpha]